MATWSSLGLSWLTPLLGVSYRIAATSSSLLGRTSASYPSVAQVTQGSSSDAVSVAAVHATIIAIFAALVVAYFGIVYSRMHSMMQGIIDDANAVGRAEGLTTSIGPHPMFEGYDPRDPSARTQLLSSLLAIASSSEAFIHADDPQPTREPDGSVPGRDDQSGRGIYLLGAISRLLDTYPFQPYADDEPPLASVSEVKNWIEDAEDVSTLLFIVERSERDVIILLDAAQKSATESEMVITVLQGQHQPATSAFLEWMRRQTHPRAMFSQFMTQGNLRRGELRSIRRDLVRHDNYRSRLPSRTVVATVFAFTTAAFATGVAAPLIDTGLSRWIYVGIPLAFYGLGTVVAGVLLYANYGKTESTPPEQTANGDSTPAQTGSAS